ncbi:MAG: pantetheine-phosphate adenylyltransferase [Bacilli bacterium]|nr:pantetheine-phosphate adenylyltransferase [Bacilli bacterium]
MRIGIYPGSFDPITNGHLDILKRAATLFDEVILLLAVNPAKKSNFTIEERLSMMKEATKDIPNAKVDYTDGFTVEYAKRVGSAFIIRGLRAVTDFEYEFQLAAANKFVDPEIEMVFLMANQTTSFISSSMINELHKNGADISPLVPPAVVKAYASK